MNLVIVLLPDYSIDWSLGYITEREFS